MDKSERNEMKLTDEQYSEIHRTIIPSLPNGTIQAIADYLQPLFAKEMLGPVTDEERWVGMCGSCADKTTNGLLKQRLSRYAPEPADKAVEAVKVELDKFDIGLSDKAIQSIVAAVDAARSKQ